MRNCLVLLHLLDDSQTRLAEFGCIPECKSKNPRGLNEISLPLARMVFDLVFLHYMYILQGSAHLSYPNSVDADQTPRYVASDLGLHCS